jgi:hypothetical protein
MVYCKLYLWRYNNLLIIATVQNQQTIDDEQFRKDNELKFHKFHNGCSSFKLLFALCICSILADASQVMKAYSS